MSKGGSSDASVQATLCQPVHGHGAAACGSVQASAGAAMGSMLEESTSSHLDAGDENKLGLALVRKQLLEEPPYRFKPEKEPESGYKHDLRQAGPVTRRHSDRVADSGRGMMDAILGLDLLGRRAAEGSVERLAG